MKSEDSPEQGESDMEARRLAGLRNQRALQARDRVLLYTRGMELPPVHGLELALQSLRRAAGKDEEALDVREALRALRAILEERGISPELEAPNGERLTSYPPLNRSRMVAEPDTWSMKTRGRRQLRPAGDGA